MIVWTEQALRQLDSAHDYITTAKSEAVADRIILLIAHRVQHLDSFPMSGRMGRVAGTRELVVSDTPFIVAYSVLEDSIVILAVYHGAQQWPEEF